MNAHNNLLASIELTALLVLAGTAWMSHADASIASSQQDAVAHVAIHAAPIAAANAAWGASAEALHAGTVAIDPAALHADHAAIHAAAHAYAAHATTV